MSVAAVTVWPKVEKTDDCWLWRGGSSKGRPIARVEGRNRNAARVLWTLTTGEPLTMSIVLMRQCETTMCVRPDHYRKSLRELGLRRHVTPEKNRNWTPLAKYGISAHDYDMLLAAQGGVCAVCQKDGRDRLGRRLHVDHDHETGVVRGLLCTRCNNAIGHAGDSASRLRELADYLEAAQ